MIGNGQFLAEMFNNYKNIKPGTYYGSIVDVFLDENHKGDKRLNFIVQYFDYENQKIKHINAIYNMAGASRTFLLAQLMPVMGFNGINISFDIRMDELLKCCKKLIGKSLPFNVEQTNNNKNIRFVPVTYYL